MSVNSPDVETVIIGGGQAGLATAWHLKRLGRSSLVLEGRRRIGDVWRERWDSLQLFTPARHSALPGAPHPSGDVFLGKDEIAGYFATYAERFDLPVRTGVRVTSVVREAAGDWLVSTSDGTMRARHVVVASGPTSLPYTPPMAGTIDASVHQLHSHDYRRPEQVPDGDVVVVGAATSGLEIALELAATHEVWIAGRPTPHIPGPVLRYAGDLWWAFISNVLTRGTPVGRKVAERIHERGSPSLRISMHDVLSAGVHPLPRLARVDRNALVFAAGDDSPAVSRPLPTTIIWCTGARPDLAWFPELPLDEHGYPVTERGIVTQLPGAYTVGMPFQWGLTSALIGGAGRDAAYVSKAIAARADGAGDVRRSIQAKPSRTGR